ncbi:hypothetical protein, partial [Streptomyces sp. NPDC088178]|uniref:hypothetical protein n=1 Tax=Streptomyces sp. NPDC088178 TaxID=3365836 RepID=UPI003829D76C
MSTPARLVSEAVGAAPDFDCSAPAAVPDAADRPATACGDPFSCAPPDLSPAAGVPFSSSAAPFLASPPAVAELAGASCTVICAATGPAFGSSPLSGSLDAVPAVVGASEACSRARPP